MSLDGIIGSLPGPGEPFFVCAFCGGLLDPDAPTTVRVVEVKDGVDGLQDVMHAACWPGDGFGWRRLVR